ncbi:protein of unknown function DUF805 [Dickeya chrysanthemi Ech1591]|uniref:DUF805 domain-containing protein n=1 Tax=Dickeya chrysanthemi (strain Ech1591) TaxID=561229 RepID=C6CG15_DICC1|nr:MULTISPECIES: DUF805 domain-containing protein [Dickeya]ACT04998.1 protein of unknown function DUF805 [Dickeya chrysanthemi Ech1591]TYL43226.1 DUF805 domain-containing protein [Dickeya sp. ws52]WJM85581.1 DUF805 domain-containing protein [Dickeya chrysanthemi]
MTIQQWCFSFRGRVGRRDFWLGMVIVLALIVGLFVLAGTGWLETQKAAFMLVVLLWPLTAILVKRLHDRNKSGWWALALVLAWMLGNGNWAMLPPLGQWGVGRFLPTLIAVMMLLDCGAFGGTTGANRFGPAAEPLRLRAS